MITLKSNGEGYEVKLERLASALDAARRYDQQIEVKRLAKIISKVKRDHAQSQHEAAQEHKRQQKEQAREQERQQKWNSRMVSRRAWLVFQRAALAQEIERRTQWLDEQERLMLEEAQREVARRKEQQ